MNKEVCLITGGTSGIGFETAKQFLRRGSKVIICSNDKEKIVETAIHELQKEGEIDFKKTDISSEAQCKETVEYVRQKYGRLDVLANVAGITEKHKFLEGYFQEIQKVLDVDLLGTLAMCKYAAKVMIPRKKGTIINVSSMCSVIVNAAEVGYHSAKAGVTRATQVLAKELAEYGIRCVSVAPGWVRTRMVGAGTETAGGKLHLRKKILEPEEIAKVIYFLSTDEAVAINGSQIMADDGLCGFKTID